MVACAPLAYEQVGLAAEVLGVGWRQIDCRGRLLNLVRCVVVALMVSLVVSTSVLVVEDLSGVWCEDLRFFVAGAQSDTVRDKVQIVCIGALFR